MPKTPVSSELANPSAEPATSVEIPIPEEMLVDPPELPTQEGTEGIRFDFNYGYVSVGPGLRLGGGRYGLLSAELGHRLFVCAHTFTPLTRLDHVQAKIGAYSESGAGGFGLIVNSQQQSFTIGSLGPKYRFDMTLEVCMPEQSLGTILQQSPAP